MSPHRENRYLLFLTENYAALQVLKHYLHEVVGLASARGGAGPAGGVEPVEGGGTLEEPQEHAQPMEVDRVGLKRKEPFVLFGSSFPRDKEYTQASVLLYMC